MRFYAEALVIDEFPSRASTRRPMEFVKLGFQLATVSGPVSLVIDRRAAML
jgi:hypothetical protein